MSATKNISNTLMDDNRNDTLSIDPDMRMDAQRQGDLHENDDALTRHPIDKPNETDKYSGYEVSLHDNNELPSAKDNLKANEKESNGSYADLNNDSTDSSANTDHLSHSDEGRNESSNNLSHPDEIPPEIKESIEPDVRMNAHQLKMPEDDDTLVHNQIDLKSNDTDKYSGYEVSLHDNSELLSAKDNLKENDKESKGSYADLNNDSNDSSADTDHLSHSDEGHNESLNHLSHPDEGPHEIKESIEPDIRMNAHQLKMPEDDDTLVHDKIDTLNDTDKYSGYEVSIHDDNETPPSAKDNIAFPDWMNHPPSPSLIKEGAGGVVVPDANGQLRFGNAQCYIKENSADFKTSAIKHLTTEPQIEIETHQNHEAKKAFYEIKKNDDTYPGSIQLDNAIDTTISPGGRLRLIREQNKMSVKHVADRLYLDARVIEALEADNYEKLPPTLFVRGYLRNYAKLMDISPESIMASFEANQQKSAPSLTAPFKKKKQASRHDLWPTVVTIIVIVTLMTLIALWQFYPNTAIDEFPLSNSPEESPWLSGTDFEHETNNITGIDETRIAAGDQNMIVSSTIVESPPAVVSVIQPEANTPPLSAEEDKTIKMHFKQNVWMRITDKTEKQLYQGIGKAGEVLSLDGLPPFKIRVGNTGVDIEYKGEIKNINEYPGQGRAFIVGVKTTP